MSSGFDNLENDILLAIATDEQESAREFVGNADDFLIDQLAQEKLINSIDTKTGAPANVRAAVSGAQSMDDKLATLRKFYPDALPVQALDLDNGVSKFGYGNFVFTNPETNQLTLFDEDLRIFGMPVPGLRDFVDVGPEIAETVGAIGGGISGGILGTAGGPIGTVGGFVAGEGLGSAAAREAYIGILDFFGETEDTRSGAERVFDFGTTAGINAVGGPIVNKIFQGVKYVGGQPLRYAFGGMSKDAKTALKNMEDIGITEPSAGMVSANPTINLFEQGLAAMPTSTKIMHENAAQTINQMDTFAKELAEKYGGVRTTSEAAEQLMDGARKARIRYDNKVTSVYDEVNDFMPDTLVSDAKNTVKFIDKYLAQVKTATGKATVHPSLRLAEKVVQDAKAGLLNYNQLKEFRSSLMHNIRAAESAGATLDAPKRKIKELIGYVTQDLDELVASSPNPRASSKYRAANEFVKANSGKSGGLTYLNNVLNKGETRATDALKYVLRGSTDGGEDLLKLKQMLNAEEYNVMSGYILGRMGLPTPGLAGVSELGEGVVKEGAEALAEQGFSPKTFITNWNRLSKEAKEELFKNTEHANLVPELDALVSTIDRIGKSTAQMANPSGSARVLGTLGLFLGVGGAEAGLGRLLGSEGFEYGFSALVAPYMSAKLLTNKSFVKWMTEGLEKAAYDPQSFGQHVRRLYQIYELNPDIREEVRSITEGLTGETLEPVAFRNSKSTEPVSEIVKNEPQFREVATSEVSEKLLPDAVLSEQITNFEMPELEVDMFPTQSSPNIISEAVLPDEADRDIARRRNQGIAGLV